jgi:hypothetical protein
MLEQLLKRRDLRGVRLTRCALFLCLISAALVLWVKVIAKLGSAVPAHHGQKFRVFREFIVQGTKKIVDSLRLQLTGVARLTDMV